MINDISELSPNALAQLTALLRGQPTQEEARSGARKVLHDLREPRNPKDRLNRPSFFWSVDASEADKPYVVQWYPKLMFKLDEAGALVETVVMSEGAEKALGPDWHTKPPMTTPMSNADRLKTELASLSDEDRAFVLEAQRQSRLSRLQASLSNLSDAALTEVAGETVTAKRGPGRPKKTDGVSA